MIRINLLGQPRPKAARKAVPLEATMQIVFAAVAVGLAILILGITYYQQQKQLGETTRRINVLRAEKASLEQTKQDVERFESQRNVLKQRIDVIESLQKNRSGAQDLLQMVANTVVRVDNLWLTTLNRTGDSLEIDGVAGSINSVANFITEMQRSGYFDKVEIKGAKENDLQPGVETFGFQMSAAISAQRPTAAAAQPAGAAHAAQPAGKGSI